MKEHVCEKNRDKFPIRKSEYFDYWVIGWNDEDENDPCYGNMMISFCPFCGIELKPTLVIKL